MNNSVFYSILLSGFLLIIFACGSSNDCSTDCLNGGVCIDGSCDCPTGFSGNDCGTSCQETKFGTWNVTSTSVGCTAVSYTFGDRSSGNIIHVSLNDGIKELSGEGLLDADCGEMTYSVSSGSQIESGAVTFNGNNLEDASSLGCLIKATKG